MAFNNTYYGARVLVTGHTGFKGSWLSAWLLRLGAQVCGYSKDIPTNPSLFEKIALSNKMEHRIGDVRDLTGLSNTVQTFQPQFVFHMAAQPIVATSYTDPIETFSSNVMGTANMLEALRSLAWPCTAVVITSDKCYDNVEWVWGYRETDALGGKDVYSGSKGCAELVVKSYWHSFFNKPDCPLKIATARAGNVIGGGDWAADRIVADCIRSWGKNARVPVRSPRATRPWQHVLEPLSGYLALGDHISRTGRGNGENYNFGPRGEQNQTVIQMLSDLGRIWGLQSEDDAYEITGNVQFHEAGLLKLNCDKALLELGWECNLLYQECMEMTGGWYREVLREDRDAMECTAAQIAKYEDLAADRRRVWASA